MAKYGILIDYDYCTGCHTCEVACQQEHDFPTGINGIRVTEHVYQSHTKVCIDNVPFLTDNCDLCINRHQAGELPSCVKHCQSQCMRFGYLNELAREMGERPKMLLYAPK